VSAASRIGLDGSGASLLGTGVIVGTVRFVNDFLERLEVAFNFEALVLTSGVAGDDLVAGLSDFFWKNPRMDLWVLPDCGPEPGCDFCDAGFGVDISFPSIPRGILDIARRTIEE
jgi:hypothetical protein